MPWIVKVTRRGQITIPMEVRNKCNIKVGDRLLVKVTKDGILLKKIPGIEEMADVDSQYGDINEVKRELEKIRKEY